MLTLARLVEYASGEPNNPDEPPWVRGSHQQRQRIEAIVAEFIPLRSGDLLEIGCYLGATSLRLARLAQEHGRRFLAIDSWSPTSTYDLEDAFKVFTKSMAPYAGVVDVLRQDAHGAEARAAIAARRFAFVFLDNGHAYEDVKAELDAVLPMTDGLVAVDDMQLVDVRNAVRDALAANPRWTMLHAAPCREAWLVPY